MAAQMTLYAVSMPTIPTFYLDAQVQGILTVEHAEKIASEITNGDARHCVMAINYWVATDSEIQALFPEN